MARREGRDSYERFALSMWESIKGQARDLFPWTVPVVVLWYMALGASYPFRWLTIPVAGWLTYCLGERLRKL